ncbi:MAG: polysaccharide pyruvyl transferase family protein [Gammaproteobacteria bacterium]|nr:polysaccharide pyruvyl transferase family protein [Gammaproteobacteria bacterium]
MKKRFTVQGWYGADNVGDEALLDGIISQLRSRFVDADICVFSQAPDSTSVRHGVPSLWNLPTSTSGMFAAPTLWQLRRAALPSLARLLRTDVFVAGGGGIISDHHPGQLDGWLWRIRLAQRLARRVVCYGVGVERILSEAAGERLRETLIRVPMISVRDEQSRSELARWGVEHNVVLSADPAFVLTVDSNAPSTLTEPGAILICAVNRFRGDLLDRYGELHAEALARFQAGRSQPIPVYLCQFMESEISLKTYLAGVPGFRGALPLYKESAAVVLRTLADASLVISTRLHGLILSLVAGVRCIPIVYSFKVQSCAQTLGIEQLGVEFGDGLAWPARKPEPERLAAGIASALSAPPPDRSLLDQLRARAQRQLDALEHVVSTLT